MELKAKKEAAENASFVGRFLNLVQSVTDANVDSMRNLFFDHNMENSQYLRMEKPRMVKHQSRNYGEETMFVLSDIEFKTAMTEKDLEGAATLMIDGNLMYTQPLPKDNNSMDE